MFKDPIIKHVQVVYVSQFYVKIIQLVPTFIEVIILSTRLTSIIKSRILRTKVNLYISKSFNASRHLPWYDNDCNAQCFLKEFCYVRISESNWVSLMLDSCRLIFERSHFERSENEFFRSTFSDLLELNSCAKLQNWLLGSIELSFLLCRDLKTRFYRTQKPDLTWMGSVQI